MAKTGLKHLDGSQGLLVTALSARDVARGTFRGDTKLRGFNRNRDTHRVFGGTHCHYRPVVAEKAAGSQPGAPVAPNRGDGRVWRSGVRW